MTRRPYKSPNPDLAGYSRLHRHPFAELDKLPIAFWSPPLQICCKARKAIYGTAMKFVRRRGSIYLSRESRFYRREFIIGRLGSGIRTANPPPGANQHVF